MRKSIYAALAAIGMLVGCGGAARATSAAMPTPSLAAASASTAAEAPPQPFASFDVSALPPAPWADAPLATAQAPAQLIAAWSQADNRDWCAPIAPRSLSGARARQTEIEGGWAIEFDQAGQRGMGRDGSGCDNCGRGVFGIVGTSMTPEELVDVDSDQTLPAPSFNDGSHSEMENSDGVAAATITVAGQGCVYQVWSFLGQSHVEELVRELRLVETPHRGTNTAVVQVDR